MLLQTAIGPEYRRFVLPDSADVEPIAELLRARRNQLGLSQADVANAVNAVGQSVPAAEAPPAAVTSNEIARWERGKRTPRARARRALAPALGLSVRLLDLAAAVQRSGRTEQTSSSDPIKPKTPAPSATRAAVDAVRAALLDYGSATFALLGGGTDDDPPDPGDLRRELADVMAAYQASRYGDMLNLLPDVLGDAHLAVHTYEGDRGNEAQRILALGGQATAMVLTKLGELDLAWMAADHGLAAAQRAGDAAVLGSLCRSVVHTLQSHGRTHAATRLTEETADNLRRQFGPTSERAASVYGTLLLAGAMAAARAGDRHSSADYLSEADFYARRIGRDANHLWTAFGPTNVAIHRVATSVALDDMHDAHAHATTVDATRMPLERRVRFAFDVALVAAERRDVDRAITGMLAAEQLAPEQVHHHVMSQQIVARLSRTSEGKRCRELTQLARRMR